MLRICYLSGALLTCLLTSCSHRITTEAPVPQMTESDRLSRSELLAIEDDVDFVGAVIDEIWALPWPEDQDEYVAYFKALPHPQRVIWATWVLQAEVDNGGFGQYFANIDHDCFIDEAIDGLTALGATDHREILEKVTAYRREHADEIGPSPTFDQYHEIMGVAALDRAFGENIGFRFINKNDELYALRRKYIMQHLDVFAPP